MFLMQKHDKQSDRPALCFGAVRHVNVQHEQHKLLLCMSLSKPVQTGLQAPDDMVAQIKVCVTEGMFWDEISPLGMLTSTTHAPPHPYIFLPINILYVLDCHSLTQLLEPFSALTFSSNFTLQYMPLPLSDISQAYRSAPERTEQALTKVGSCWQSSS